MRETNSNCQRSPQSELYNSRTTVIIVIRNLHCITNFLIIINFCQAIFNRDVPDKYYLFSSDGYIDHVVVRLLLWQQRDFGFKQFVNRDSSGLMQQQILYDHGHHFNNVLCFRYVAS